MDKSEIKFIKAYLKQGKSLSQVAKSLGKSKSTIYYWYKKFGFKRKLREVRIDKSKMEKVGEFVGVFAGDGSFAKDKYYHYQITIHVSIHDKGYVNHVKALMKELTGKDPFVFVNKKSNVILIRIVSKKFYEFIKEFLVWKKKKTYTVHLKNPPHFYGKKFCIGFVRGITDTDGWIGTKRIKISTTSKFLCKDIENALRMLKINYVVYRERLKSGRIIYRVCISKDYKKFLSMIKPYHNK